LSSNADHSPSTPRRWRVLVIGHSVATMVPDRTSRLDGPYPELVEQWLRADGHDVEVRNAAKEFTHIGHGVRIYQDTVATWNPDVVVVNYGVVESQAPFIPQAVYNHFQTWDVGTSRLSRAYRRRVAPWLWTRLRRLQRRAVGVMGQRGHRVGPARFTTLLRQLIFLARHEHRLVLILDINPPGPRITYSLPGAQQRRDRYNDLTHQVVREAQVGDADGVRLIPSASVVHDLGIEKALPDGYHFSVEGHRRIAEMVVAEIEAWIARTTS
jgi:lysophospholipase L1-like esterase